MKMKKLMALLLAGVLVLSLLAGCGDNSTDESNPPSTNSDYAVWRKTSKVN